LASREHVIPHWVRERLALTSEVTIEVSSAAAARWPNLYIKLDQAVCADCNNGWMSELEKAVQPFLGPMLLNEHGVELDTDQQRDLARWATIKILLLELSMRQQHSRRQLPCPGVRHRRGLPDGNLAVSLRPGSREGMGELRLPKRHGVSAGGLGVGLHA
jgi:hypothetical protein